jgi:hypothetical protein
MVGKLRWIVPISIIILILAGCNYPFPGSTATQVPQLDFTQAAQTLSADLTQKAPIIVQTVPGAQETVSATGTPPAVISTTAAATITPAETVTPTGSQTPAATPQTALPSTSTALLTKVVLEDDFSNHKFWFTETNNQFSIEFVQGGYQFTVNAPNAPVRSVRSTEYGDVGVRTVAQQTNGPVNGYYGVICRYQDGDNFYALVVSSDGTYGIAKMMKGEFGFLQEGSAQAGVIKPAGTDNQVQGDCVGDTLTLFANGQQLAQVRDGDFPNGVVGLIAGTRKETGTQVVFKNFTVLQP